MATITSDLATLQAKAKINAKDRVFLNERVCGVLHRARARITFAAALASGDIIEIVELPEGAVVNPQLSHARTGGLTAAVSLDIGYSGNTDAYSDGLALGTAEGCKNFNQGATALGDKALTPTPLTAATMITAKANGAYSVAAGEYIEFEIVYAMRA